RTLSPFSPPSRRRSSSCRSRATIENSAATNMPVPNVSNNPIAKRIHSFTRPPRRDDHSKYVTYINYINDRDSEAPMLGQNDLAWYFNLTGNCTGSLYAFN